VHLLSTLGSASLFHRTDAGERCLEIQPKRLALLVFLTRGGHGPWVRRDTLLSLFWPDADDAHARGALRQSLTALRRLLGSDVLLTRGEEEVGLTPAGMACDATDFEQACASGQPALADALYTGDFLAGFHVDSVAPEFGQWVDRERTRLRLLACATAWEAAAASERHGLGAEASLWARRAVALAPEDEVGVGRLIELLDRQGDRAGALSAFDLLQRQLAADYGSEPSPETRALISAVRLRTSARPASGPHPAPDEAAGPPVVAHPASAARAQTPDLGVESRPRTRVILWVAAIGVVAIGGYVAAFSRNELARPSLDGNLVAVAPFEVLEPELALWHEGLIDYLSRNLDGAGALRTVVPTLVVRRSEGRSDRASAVLLGERTGAGLVLFGQVVGAGPDSVRLRASLLDASTGRILGEFERQDLRDRVDRAADSLTVDLVRVLGGTGRWAPRLASIGTRSIPALKEFLQGEQYYRRSNWDSALVHYAIAVQRDPTFALALRRMFLALGWDPPTSGRYESLDWYAARAIVHNHGLAPRDSLLIRLDSIQILVMSYDSTFAQQYRVFMTAHEELVRRYPDDPEAWERLGEARFHFALPPQGTPQSTLDAFDHAIALDSGNASAHEHTAQLALWLHDPARARRYLRAYLALNSTDFAAGGARLLAALLDSQSATPEVGRLIDTLAAAPLWNAVFAAGFFPDSEETAVRLIRSLRSRPSPRGSGAPDFVTDSFVQQQVEARTLALRGHLGEAWDLQRSLGYLHPAEHDWMRTIGLALFGAVPVDTMEELIRLQLQADRSWRNPPRDALAWWFAQGDTAAIARLAARADKAGGDRGVGATSRLHASYVVQLAAAYLALARGDSASAVERFTALPDSLCILADCFLERLTTSHLLAARAQQERAATLLDPWLYRNEDGFLVVPATLDRARWAERLGDRDTAERLYRWVAAMWRNADPSLQGYVREARAGMDRLGRSTSRSP